MTQPQADLARQHQRRRFRTRPTPACACRRSCRAATSWWWRTRTWRSCGPPRLRSPGSTTSPTSISPVPISTFQVPGLDMDGAPQPPMTGCHQPSERFTGTVDSVRVVRAGLAPRRHRRPVRTEGSRLLHAGRRPAGADRASSNDVTIDSRGLIYLIDRSPRRRRHRNCNVWMDLRATHDARSATIDYAIGKKNPNLPFHPAVRAGDFIFVSGQVGKDADSNMIARLHRRGDRGHHRDRSSA